MTQVLVHRGGESGSIITPHAPGDPVQLKGTDIRARVDVVRVSTTTITYECRWFHNGSLQNGTFDAYELETAP